MLPGVPKEMRQILKDSVIPIIKSRFKLKEKLRKVLRTVGLHETQIYEKLGELEGVGFYPSFTGVDLLIEADSRDELNSKELLIRNKLGDYIYGEEDDTLESCVGRLLREKKLTISVAESCTGGLVEHRITNVPGSSEYFVGGVVAYSNEMKMKVLGVKEDTLESFGAVSYETACEMAEGVAKLTGSDVAVSTTGIAGPTGGTPTKPVGLVFFGVYYKGEVKAYRHQFQGDRLLIKEQSAQTALDLIRRTLIKE